ncbi:MAG: hypothetical protein AB8H47_13630 [Bacteroidia bacterium]
MKKPYLFIASLLGVVLLSSCTAEPLNLDACIELAKQPSGFWLGLWHGCIAPVTFILSLFVDTIEMYDVFNNGGWYNFGFVLGAGILFGGSGSGVKRRRRKE